jgi:hypothetical protein
MPGMNLEWIVDFPLNVVFGMFIPLPLRNLPLMNLAVVLRGFFVKLYFCPSPAASAVLLFFCFLLC